LEAEPFPYKNPARYSSPVPRSPAPKNTPVPNRRRGRPAQDRPRVEDRLLQAVERLLEQGHPFGGLSVEQLSEEAGIARATFYLHFGDKGELVARLLSRVTAEIVAGAGLWFKNAERAERDDIEQALRGIIGVFRKHQAVFAAVADTAIYDRAVASLHTQMMEQLCAESRRALAGVKRAGAASPQATPELADMLTHLVELYCAHFIARCNDDQVDQVIALFTHICASAIFAAPAAGTKKRASGRRKGQ
jgi:AcrR family transcriptional regulator